MRADGVGTTPLGLGKILDRVTQCSAGRATLGWGTQSRWDWEWRVHQSWPVKGLVQQRLFQCLQRGELALVEVGEALGFWRKLPQRGNGHQPRVAESGRLPWVNPTKCNQPQRGC